MKFVLAGGLSRASCSRHAGTCRVAGSQTEVQVILYRMQGCQRLATQQTSACMGATDVPNNESDANTRLGEWRANAHGSREPAVVGTKTKCSQFMRAKCHNERPFA